MTNLELILTSWDTLLFRKLVTQLVICRSATSHSQSSMEVNNLFSVKVSNTPGSIPADQAAPHNNKVLTLEQGKVVLVTGGSYTGRHQLTFTSIQAHLPAHITSFQEQKVLAV